MAGAARTATINQAVDIRRPSISISVCRCQLRQLHWQPLKTAFRDSRSNNKKTIPSKPEMDRLQRFHHLPTSLKEPPAIHHRANNFPSLRPTKIDSSLALMTSRSSALGTQNNTPNLECFIPPTRSPFFIFFSQFHSVWPGSVLFRSTFHLDLVFEGDYEFENGAHFLFIEACLCCYRN